MIYKHTKTGQLAVCIHLDPETAFRWSGQRDHVCLVQLVGSGIVKLYTLTEFEREFQMADFGPGPIGSLTTEARVRLVDEGVKAFAEALDAQLKPILSRLEALENTSRHYSSRTWTNLTTLVNNKVDALERSIDKRLDPLEQSHAARLTIGEKVGELFRAHVDDVNATQAALTDVGRNLRLIRRKVGMPDELVINGKLQKIESSIGINPEPVFDIDDFDDYDEAADVRGYYGGVGATQAPLSMYAIHAKGMYSGTEYTYYARAKSSADAVDRANDYFKRSGYMLAIVGTQKVDAAPPKGQIIP